MSDEKKEGQELEQLAIVECGDKSNLIDFQKERKAIESCERPKNQTVLNYYMMMTKGTDKNNKPTNIQIKLPRDVNQILAEIKEIVPDWPKRVGTRLFWINDKKEISWLDKTPQITVFLELNGVKLNFPKIPGGISKEELFHALSYSAEAYDTLSRLPHFPSLPRTYYEPIELPVAGNSSFQKLLDYFMPAHGEDIFLLKAAFLSLFWGGASGTRPGFAIMSLDSDIAGGRGVGKSTLMDTMARLTGGYINMSYKSGAEKMTSLILTSGDQRIIRVDNIKGSRLSNSAIEDAITAPWISGHRIYAGLDQRPNYYNWLFSLNNVGFSTDIAQRAIPIRLGRPDYETPNWAKDVRDFVETKRLEIIADIRDIFAKAPAKFEGSIRFKEWQDEVLARTGASQSIISHILGAQNDVDDEKDDAGAYEEVVFLELEKYGFPYGMQGRMKFDPSIHSALIPKNVVAGWIKSAKGYEMSPKKLTSIIRSAGLTYLKDHPTLSICRVFLWSKKMPGDLKSAWRIPPGPAHLAELREHKFRATGR